MLGCATMLAWTLALVAFAKRPLRLGTALIAYSFGLRHAVDDDHISAIDNVTRKLGHSTVVVALTIAIAVGASVVKASMPNMQNAGGPIGTSVSALYLFVIATLNVVVFLGVYDAFRRVRRGGIYNEEAVNAYLADRGLLGRFFSTSSRSLSHSSSVPLRRSASSRAAKSRRRGLGSPGPFE